MYVLLSTRLLSPRGQNVLSSRHYKWVPSRKGRGRRRSRREERTKRRRECFLPIVGQLFEVGPKVTLLLRPSDRFCATCKKRRGGPTSSTSFRASASFDHQRKAGGSGEMNREQLRVKEQKRERRKRKGQISMYSGWKRLHEQGNIQNGLIFSYLPPSHGPFYGPLHPFFSSPMQGLIETCRPPSKDNKTGLSMERDCKQSHKYITVWRASTTGRLETRPTPEKRGSFTPAWLTEMRGIFFPSCS